MTALVLALSISSSITKYGSYAGFASIIGLAVLSLLYFSQAREVKRLREWAGRAPERAAELEQRVSVDAASRVRPPAPVAARAVTAAVPSRVAGSVAPVVPGTAVAAPPVTGTPPAPATATGTPGAPATAAPAAVPSAPPAAVPAIPAPPSPSDLPAPEPQPAVAAAAQAPPAPDAPSSTPPPPIAAELKSVEAVGESASATVGESPAVAEPTVNGDHAAGDEDESVVAAAPATAAAAARAAGTTARAVVPPGPGAAPAAGGTLPPAPRVIRRPDAPVAPPRRASGPPPDRSSGPESRLQELGSRAGASSPSARIAVLGIAAAAVIVLVVLFFVLHGSSHTATPTAAASHSSSAPATTSAHSAPAAPASNPATLPVAVINGTTVTDLAHHLADDLIQNGYNDASPLTGQPSGTAATTTVYYAAGHRADARGVAQVLGVTSEAPITPTIRTLSGTQPIVVVAGMDQASAAGTGGTGASG